MATSRPFTYNPSPNPSINGTEQVGDLSIGIPISGITTSPQFWNGPDEELGYVVAHPSPSGFQPNPLFIPAYLGFWRTADLTDGSFIDLAQYISIENATPQTFSSATQASTWLTTNGYWNSYATSFTIQSIRVTNPNSFGGNFAFTTQNGYQLVDNYNNNLYPTYYFDITDNDSDILAVFEKAGINTNSSQGYMFYCSWGPGSTPASLVKIGYYSPGKQMYMIVVDGGDKNWQTNNTNTGTALVGQFNFPAKFTIYNPITDKNGWC